MQLLSNVGGQRSVAGLGICPHDDTGTTLNPPYFVPTETLVHRPDTI